MRGRLTIVAAIGALAAGQGCTAASRSEAGQTFPEEKVSRAHIEWCYKRHPTYRLLDNTYVDGDGVRRKCVSPYS